MYRLGVLCSQPVHFGHFSAKMYRLGVFFILSRYILASLGENVPAGGFPFSAGTFWPFWERGQPLVNLKKECYNLLATHGHQEGCVAWNKKNGAKWIEESQSNHIHQCNINQITFQAM